jgi:translation initiation factor IF-3
VSILKEKQLFINERIRAKEVRLIGVASQQLGIVSIQEALKYASNVGLDLIEVSPQANPPVCKVMDYGKYKYEQGKRERDAAKKQKQVEIKTIRMRPATDDHDFNFKTNNAIKFLKQGNKVKVQIMFKSREITHPEIAKQNMDKIAAKIAAEGCGKVEKGPIIEGKSMNMMLAPVEN